MQDLPKKGILQKEKDDELDGVEMQKKPVSFVILFAKICVNSIARGRQKRKIAMTKK